LVSRASTRSGIPGGAVVATHEECQDLGRLLRDVWGFDLAQEATKR
jgi:hypothetical protein